MAQSAFAQGAPGASGGNPLGLIAVLAGLALLPFLLIMVTSFVKVAVVLSLLRTAIGAQQVPPNQVIIGLAIVLTVLGLNLLGDGLRDLLDPRLRVRRS